MFGDVDGNGDGGEVFVYVCMPRKYVDCDKYT